MVEINDPLIGNDNLRVNNNTFDDISAATPSVEYWNRSSLNKSAYSNQGHKLSFIGLGGDNIDIINPSINTEYTKTDVNVTSSGHVIEYNDTPGNERILLKHRTGAGIDILPDGSVAISARGKHVMTILDDMTIVVSGNAKYQFKGNLDFDVKGALNINASEMNVSVTGNVTENIGGALRSTITGNKGEVVSGNVSLTTLKTATNTILGDYNNIIKGNSIIVSEGNNSFISGKTTKISSETALDVASDKINLVAAVLSALGATGTIGGQGVVMYGKGGTFEEGVTAPTFHGALEGNAKTATQAGRAGTAGALGAGGSAGTEVNTATPVTAKPTSSNINDLLNVSSKGIQRVAIKDVDIKNVYNKSDETGGLSVNNPTTAIVRSKLRDPANRNNAKFISSQLARGTLNVTYAQTTAPRINRIIPKTPVAIRGSEVIGNGSTSNTFNSFKPAEIPTNKSFTPDLQYIIED
jgi:hypothetical protein